MRSERWNTKSEIIRRLNDTMNKNHGAGPILFTENSRKYSDDSQSHISVTGSTGKGKSQCCSLPFEREILLKNESLIMLDPKGEGHKRNDCFIPKNYQKICIDFRNPRKSDRWNPLSTPYKLYKSGNLDELDIACTMISEFWAGVYPHSNQADPFWCDSAINFAKSLTFSLFDFAPEEEVNLESIAIMMQYAEMTVFGKTMMREFYDFLPPESLASRNLAPYVSAPKDTRGCIHSVAVNGLEVFSRSKGLMSMMSEDTLNILDIDVNKPFAFVIIIPDETDVYDSLAGLLVSQLSQHLVRVAQELGGKLPIRVNLILEELGSVGKSIINLPNLMVAGRSRNIRIMLILQSNKQLIDVYGQSKAETINSCVGISITFSTNCWETLTEFSQRCGEKEIEVNGYITRESLITAAQLAAMPTGTALVMNNSQSKFITQLPFYNEMYDNSQWVEPVYDHEYTTYELRAFRFEKFVKKIHNDRLECLRNDNSQNKSTTKPQNRQIFMNNKSSEMEEMLAEMDGKMNKLTQNFKNEEVNEKSQRIKVIISDIGRNRNGVINIMMECCKFTEVITVIKLKEIPIMVDFDTLARAADFKTKMDKIGAKVRIVNNKEDETNIDE